MDMVELIAFLFFLSISQARLVPRFTGGYVAKEQEFPNVVALTAHEGDPLVFKVFCVGTIVNPNWILTGHHCTIYIGTIYTQENVRVVAGTLNLKDLESSDLVSAIEYTTADDYFEEEWYQRIYNIGLIRLAAALALNYWVKPLPFKEAQNFTGAAIIAGWGPLTTANEESKNDINVLQTANVEIVNMSKCKNIINKIVTGSKRAFAEKHLHESHICTNFLAPEGVLASDGDSGGPLMMKMESGDYEVIGVISETDKTPEKSEKTYVTLHTMVGHFTRWMDRTIELYEFRRNSVKQL